MYQSALRKAKRKLMIINELFYYYII